MMKDSIIYIFLISLIALSCNNTQRSNPIYSVDLYSPEYSLGFTIKSSNDTSNVIISVLNPWQGSKDAYSELIILKDDSDMDLNRNRSENSIFNEAKRIICMSSTHIAMLDALGATDRIVGVSGKQYVSNPAIRLNDSIKDIGYEGNFDYETILNLRPDLILLFSVNGASAIEPKLKEFGIPYLYIGDYVEKSPLGKSEWLVPVAEIIGKRKNGIDLFNRIKTNYNNLKDSVALSTDIKPKVMVNAPFGDSWFMPSTDSYVAQMIKDAGGEYIYKVNSGNTSLPIDLETALSLVSESDLWINIGAVKDLNEFKTLFPKFINSDCVIKGNLYNNNKRSTPGGGNDSYETGAVFQDSLLRDMITIFHPELLDEELSFYKKLD